MPYAPDLAGAALDGRYELHELVGEGTFGRVYRGFDRRLLRPVAVKVIKPWWGEDPEWVQSFEREAQLLARVSDPGIVQIFDVGQTAQGLYYVAEFVDGESLQSRLRRGPLPAGPACEIAERLCHALAHTHARQIVHRDIKPGNILLGADGEVKVGDFSVARLAEGSSEVPATVAGTPRYMAPEQSRGLPASPATDLYSVGVVLYEMLAGHPPFSGNSPVEVALHHLHDQPPPLPDDVPPELASIVARSLAKQPEHRFPSASSMAQALVAAREAIPTKQTKAAPGGMAPGWADPGGTGIDRVDPDRAGPDRAAPEGTARVAARPESTRVAPRFGPRRNNNPSARRRSIAAFALALGVLGALVAAAALTGATPRVRVPDLRGLSRSSVVDLIAPLKLRTAFAQRYDNAPVGRVVAQSPDPGRLMKQGSTVRVTLSAGPAPVRVPGLRGQTDSAATATLARMGLSARASSVPAPGTPAGIVVGQTPPAGQLTPAHTLVTLSVAESPRWRSLARLSGSDTARSLQFRIRGRRWRVVYRMSYVGMCTFILVCSGPSAHVGQVGGATSSFDLNDGGRQLHTFDSGPGSYRLQVTPGGDTATWAIEVQDRY